MSTATQELRPPQQQELPGEEHKMHPQPVTERPKQTLKLKNKTAFISGGDSGIGKAVAILFAQEGADVAITYLNEHDDALETQKRVEHYGRTCILIPGDITSEDFCKKAIEKTLQELGKIDILINNAAVQYEAQSIEDITTGQLVKTFQTNVYPMFWFTQHALKHMQEGSCIINTASITAYRGSAALIDYASTKGAIVAFTRSLSANLAERGIRVNGVAPGPIWTPLIPGSFDPEKVAKFGSDVPMQRAGEPVEVAPSYLFLACEDSSYMTGQFLHPNGGTVLNT